MMSAKPPTGLGVRAGKLSPCPDSPNCVGSQDADDAHAVAPLKFTGALADARTALKQIVIGMPRTKLVAEEERYLRFECRSAVFRFVDDLEFCFDESERVIHVRSASRVGHSDLGVNRRRVEAIHAAFAARP